MDLQRPRARRPHRPRASLRLIATYAIGPVPWAFGALLVLAVAASAASSGAGWAAWLLSLSVDVRHRLQAWDPSVAAGLVLGWGAVVELGLWRNTHAGIRARLVARAALAQLWDGRGDARRLRATALLWWHAAIESARALVLWAGVCHMLAWHVLAVSVLFARSGPLIALPNTGSAERCVVAALLAVLLARAQGRRGTSALLLTLMGGAVVGHWASGPLAWYALGAGITRLAVVGCACRQSPLYSQQASATDSVLASSPSRERPV